MTYIGVDVHIERVRDQWHGFDAKSFLDLDAGDAQGANLAVEDSLRRVIKALENACL